MVNPTFTKATVTTVTFEKGEATAQPQSTQPQQDFARAYGNGSKVNTWNSTPLEFMTISFSLVSQATIDNIKAFFNDAAMNWRANTFTFTDSKSNAFNVQLVDNGFPRVRSVNEKYSFEMNLEVV